MQGSFKSIFLQAKDKGIGTIVAVNVFNPDTHQTNGSPDPATITNLDIIGGFDISGQASGAAVAYGCFQAFGWFPKILAAPGFMNMTGVATAFKAFRVYSCSTLEKSSQPQLVARI